MPEEANTADDVDFDSDRIFNLSAGDIADLGAKAQKFERGSNAHDRIGLLMLTTITLSLVRIADAIETMAEKEG